MEKSRCYKVHITMYQGSQATFYLTQDRTENIHIIWGTRKYAVPVVTYVKNHKRKHVIYLSKKAHKIHDPAYIDLDVKITEGQLEITAKETSTGIGSSFTVPLEAEIFDCELYDAEITYVHRYDPEQLQNRLDTQKECVRQHREATKKAHES